MSSSMFMLMSWTYFYALSYCPSPSYIPIQTFQPFPANGLNEQASPTMTFWGGILST
jgi:hypothetical protein